MNGTIKKDRQIHTDDLWFCKKINCLKWRNEKYRTFCLISFTIKDKQTFLNQRLIVRSLIMSHIMGK